MAPLLKVVMVISTNTTEVSTVVSIIFFRSSDIPLYVHMSYMLKVATSNQELKIYIVLL